jgi:hypothetical protein
MNTTNGKKAEPYTPPAPPSAKDQEKADEARLKAEKDAQAKANKNPVDAHGNPMPNLK